VINFLKNLYYYKLLGGTFKDGLERIVITDKDGKTLYKLTYNESVSTKIYAKQNNIKEEYALKLLFRRAILDNKDISDEDKQKFI